MTRPFHLLAVSCMILCLASCARDSCAPGTTAATPTAEEAPAPEITGERLVYVVGCVNCHHQTPKEILNAPPLVIVQSYSLSEFRKLLKTGVTRAGRDMYAEGSIMGIVAREQLSMLTDDEVRRIHEFLQSEWTAERGAREEAKIPLFPPPTFTQQQ